MRSVARILLAIALAAPAAGAWASPGSIPVQQAIRGRVVHRVVQQNEQALRREIDLRRARAEKEREPATSTPPPSGPRQP